MLNDIKTSTKLLVGFGTAILITLFVGLLGRQSLGTASEHIDELGNNRIPSLYGLEEMSLGAMHEVAGERGLINPIYRNRPEAYEELAAGIRQATEGRRIYEPLPQTREEARIWSRFTPRWDEWQRDIQKIVDVERERDALVGSGAKPGDSRLGQIDERIAVIRHEEHQERVDSGKMLNELIRLNNEYGKTTVQQSQSSASRSAALMLVAMLLGFAIASILGIVIARSVKRALTALTRETGRIAEAAVAGELETRAEPTAVPAEFRPILRGTNEMLDAVLLPIGEVNRVLALIRGGNLHERVEITCKGDHDKMKQATNGVHAWLTDLIAYVTKIANGDLTATIEKSSNEDQVHESLVLMKQNIQNLVLDANMLSKAAVQGKLATRADASKHQGDFRRIVQGVNETLDAVIDPLNVAADYVDKISKGNIPNKITDTYHGDFNAIKNNLNRCIESLNGVLAASATMYEAQKAGDIEAYVDANQFQGAYRQLANGVNEGVKLHVTNILTILNIVSSYSEGDFTPVLAKLPGKQVVANERMDKLRHNLMALISDANALSKAAVEGKLATRADASKHQGDFRKIVQGVNETLDAVIGPLNVAADYVDKISKGNIPNKITDTYHGDFNAIKNNLNDLVGTINLLIEDMGNMSKQHDAGDIDVKIPEERFAGAYRVMAKGVNDMVFGHIAVKKKAMACLAQFAAGNFDAPLEKFPGKKVFINENIELLRRNSKALIADADMLVKASIEGKLSTRADATKHDGDFRKIVDGVNKTLDAVIAPVMDATDALESLARYDLRVRVTGDYQGDHARIKDAVNGTAKALQDALIQVADAIEQVAEASQQIAGSSQAVSQGASEQASSLEETSSSLEQMAGMTKQNADNTIQARSLAQTTKEAAEKGGQAMTRMTDAMEKIRAASEGTAQIIKDINEIAFQTNLLALNAAVEAARAGDAGRGFAVVAEEVRSLALRSKEAAKKTEDLIKVAVGHSENGRVITNEVAGSLTEIVTAAAKVNDIVSEIAVASQEQSRGIEQVNTAVAEMDKVVQTAASNAEESSSAAEELASQSEELSSLIQRFELDRDNRTAARRHAAGAKEAASQRRAALHPATIPPPRRGAVHGNRAVAKKPSGTNGTRKPSPEELIPLESEPEFQDF
jgi:methyl-accepting chemotaxis protein